MLISQNVINASEHTEDIRNSFVVISKGSFVMGSPNDELGKGPHENQVQVTISKNFAMMKTELTQLQYFQVMGSNPSFFSKIEHCPQTHKIMNGVELCPSNPVERISYLDIVNKFIPKLNEITGINYRLPTEAEWEFAARAGTVSAYSFGSDDIGKYAWYGKNSQINEVPMTHPVASKLSNGNGLYDMHGNVWELVMDQYERVLPGGVDPLVLSGDWPGFRVARGGSYGLDILRNGNAYLRSGSRVDCIQSYADGRHIGFRLAKDLTSNTRPNGGFQNRRF